MFTGIVEEMGEVVSMQEVKDLELWDGSTGAGFVLVVRCAVALDGAYLGASISINGTCLTVTAFDEASASFGIAPETLRLTNLAQLSAGDKVNVERAAKMSDRNSGHYVQGHVDGMGEIVEKAREGESLRVRVKVPAAMMTGLVHKGFVAVDGASLTICDVDAASCTFTFMLISHTQCHVVIPLKEVGHKLNIELDVMGKFVQQALHGLSERVSTVEKNAAAQMAAVMARLDALEALKADTSS